MSQYDEALSAAELDATELEALRDELATEIAGLDEIEAEIDKFLERLAAEGDAT